MAHLHSYDSELSFFHIDNHVKVLNSSDFKSLEELVTILGQSIPADSKHRDLLIARGILIWIGQAKSKMENNYLLNDSEIDIFTAETGLSDAFCSLCKKAGIEAEKVFGDSKDVSYLVGNDTIKTGDWAIFKAYKKWHIVMPTFAVSCLVGFQPGGEIAIESDGVTNVQVREHQHGFTAFHFNDFWFCTNPKYFVTICRAENLQNQLISRPISQEEYLGIPELDEGFFKARLQCLTENSCRLTTKNGKCTIVLRSENPKANLLKFSYSFSMVGEDTEGLNDLSRLVMYYPNFARKEFTFEIRFPKVGVYILRIYVPDLQNGDINSCCNFRIECTEVNPNFGKLPIINENEGWGFGIRAKDAGLLRPSNPKPKIAIQLREKAHETEEEEFQIEKITFELEEDTMEEMVYEAVICGSEDVKDGDFKTETIVHKDNRLLEVISTIKGKGEYGLVIKAKDKTSYTDYKSVVNYLLTTFEDKAEIDHADQALAKRRKEVVQDGKRSVREERKSKLVKEVETLEKELNTLEKSSKLLKNNEASDNDMTGDESDSSSEKQRKDYKDIDNGVVKDGNSDIIYKRIESANEQNEPTSSFAEEVDIRKKEKVLNRTSIEENAEENVHISKECITFESGVETAEGDTHHDIVSNTNTRGDDFQYKLNKEEFKADEQQCTQNNSTSGWHNDSQPFNEGNNIERCDVTKHESYKEDEEKENRPEQINPYQESVNKYNDKRIQDGDTDDKNNQLYRIAEQNEGYDNNPSELLLEQHDEASKNHQLTKIHQDKPAIETHVDESNNKDKITKEQQVRSKIYQDKPSQDQYDGESNNSEQNEDNKIDQDKHTQEHHCDEEMNEDNYVEGGENNQDNRNADNIDNARAQDKRSGTENKPQKNTSSNVKPRNKTKQEDSSESKACVLI